MIWLIFSIIAFVLSIGWAFIVVQGNVMSDNPNAGFVGGWSILLGFGISAALLLVYFFG